MSVGLDIGSNSIKVVELEKNSGRFVLKSLGVAAYSKFSIDGAKSEKDLLPIADLIKKLFSETRISSRSVFLSLPEKFAFVKVVDFPPLTDQEVEAALKWQLDQYIPISLEEAVVQHKIVEKKDTSPGGVKVLLVAAKTSNVEKYVSLAEMSGLKVLAVENELVSLSRLFGVADNYSVVIVNFGLSSVNIGVAKNRNLYLSRSIQSGGDSLTRAIVQDLRVETNQAEEYKKAYGLLSDQLEGKLLRAMKPVLLHIVDEIRKAIHYFESEDNSSVKQIVVCGGVAGMPGLLPYLTKEFNQEVLVGNPFADLSIPQEFGSQISDYAHLYGVAVGLAERD